MQHLSCLQLSVYALKLPGQSTTFLNNAKGSIKSDSTRAWNIISSLTFSHPYSSPNSSLVSAETGKKTLELQRGIQYVTLWWWLSGHHRQQWSQSRRDPWLSRQMCGQEVSTTPFIATGHRKDQAKEHISTIASRSP